jgi:hypothetical protein
MRGKKVSPLRGDQTYKITISLNAMCHFSAFGGGAFSSFHQGMEKGNNKSYKSCQSCQKIKEEDILARRA